MIRDERGLAVDFEREGEYVPFGNNDDRTDSIAVEITEKFMEYLRQHETIAMRNLRSPSLRSPLMWYMVRRLVRHRMAVSVELLSLRARTL